MKDELGASARALLDAARDGMSPDAAAIARMRGKIGVSVAGATTMTLAAKLGIAGAVIALAAGGAIIARSGDEPAVKQPAPAITTTRSQPTPAPKPTETARVGTSTATIPSATPAAPPAATPAAPPAATPAATATIDPKAAVDADKIEILTPPPAPSVPTAPGKSSAPRTTPVPAPAAPRSGEAGAETMARAGGAGSMPRVVEVQPPSGPSASTAIASSRKRADLAREVELIDQAMAALRRHDYTAALTAVQAHGVETGNAGQLAEDAAAIDIEATCRSHQSVFAKLEAFDARWPASAQRSRLTNNCP